MAIKQSRTRRSTNGPGFGFSPSARGKSSYQLTGRELLIGGIVSGRITRADLEYAEQAFTHPETQQWMRTMPQVRQQRRRRAAAEALQGGRAE